MAVLTLLLFYRRLEEKLPVTIWQKAGCVPEPNWAVWRRENPLPLLDIEPRLLGRPVRRLETIPVPT